METKIFLLFIKIILIMEIPKKIVADKLLAKIATADFSSMELEELLQLGLETKITILTLQGHSKNLTPDQQKILQAIIDNNVYLTQEMAERGFIIGDSDELLNLPPEQARQSLADMPIARLYDLLEIFSKGKGEDDAKICEIINEELTRRTFSVGGFSLN